MEALKELGITYLFVAAVGLAGHYLFAHIYHVFPC